MVLYRGGAGCGGGWLIKSPVCLMVHPALEWVLTVSGIDACLQAWLHDSWMLSINNTRGNHNEEDGSESPHHRGSYVFM